jgi:glycerol kinase
MGAMAYLLALDQGTTSSRAIVFDETGRKVAVAQKEFTQSYPQPGWVEHDPREIFSSQAGVATEAVTTAGLRPGELAAIGITNQRETVVLWERSTGHPVAPAIVWQDRRTAADCDRLKAAGAEVEVQQRTGLLLDPYFSGTKLAWLLHHVDGARARAERGELAFGTVDSWLLWNLTLGGVHATDASNASRTLLYNIHTGQWDQDLLEMFDIPPAVLPEVRPSSGLFGQVARGLLQDVPILGVAGDQQAALFGQACTQPGLAKNTYGTGCFLLQNTGTSAVPSRNRLLTTVAWEIGGRREFASEGSVFIGGAVVQWLRDGLKVIRSAAEIEALAASVPDSGGVTLVPAFAGLGAPHWDPYARGTMTGITRGTTVAHIARAALESIALQSADLLSAMRADGAEPLTQLRVDGGASGNNLLMQIQADLLGVPVVRPAETETTALGAAYLAGLGAGLYPDTSAIAAHWMADRLFEPRGNPELVVQVRQNWRRAVDRAKQWLQP